MTANATGDFTATEAKHDLHCANAKLWELIKSGELEAYYVGRQIRIPRESMAAYKQRNRVTPDKFLGIPANVVIDPMS